MSTPATGFDGYTKINLIDSIVTDKDLLQTVLSVLSELAMHLLVLTNGRLSKCAYVAEMVNRSTRKPALIVNDPFGFGWKTNIVDSIDVNSAMEIMEIGIRLVF